MSLLKAESFDGPTAPAVPGSPWTFDAAYATSAGASGISPGTISSPNVLEFTPGSNGTYWSTWGTADGASGNVIVSCYAAAFAAAGRPIRLGVTFRGTGAVLNSSTTSAYAAWFDWGSQVAGISKVISGTETTLGTTATTSAPPSNWAFLYAVANGTALSLSVQRQADGLFLNPSGNWLGGIGHPACVSVTDGSLSGSGYAGLYAVQSGSGFTGYFDNWELDGITPPVPMPSVHVVPVPFQFFPTYQV